MYAGERFNSITHLIGTIMAVAGTAVIVSLAAGTRAIIAFTVYGTMMIAMYLSSTLYHSIRGPSKEIFHVFDHCAIYLLIAGTYTPFTLLTLRGPVGWWLFATIWALAIAGILKDIFFRGRFKIASVVLYILMGWLVVVAFGPLRQSLPAAGIAWLAAGGIVYTAGIVFYALSKHV
ncbi:MAG TPA: hemolysin III family protein, partial [Thermoanaerobaculia bacterium]